MPTIPKNNAFILLFTRLEELAVDKNGQHKARVVDFIGSTPNIEGHKILY